MPPLDYTKVTHEDLQKAIDTLVRNRLTLYEPNYDSSDVLVEFLKAVEGVPNVHVSRVPSKIVSLYYASCDGELVLTSPVLPTFRRTR